MTTNASGNQQVDTSLAGVSVFSCTSSACTGTVNAPLGTDTFQVALGTTTTTGSNAPTFTSFDALLSFGNATATVLEGQANTINLTFGAVPANVTLASSPANPTFYFGVASQNVSFTWKFFDAAGFQIVDCCAGSIAINRASQPQTIPNFYYDFEPTHFASGGPGSGIVAGQSSATLSYSGRTDYRPTDPLTVALISGNLESDVTVRFMYESPTGPSSISVLGTGAAGAQTATISEVGYDTTPYTVDTSNHTIATAVVGTTSNGSATVTVTGVSAGSCNLVVSDNHGNTLTIPVTVSS